MAATYTVKYGDCLWTIAETQLGSGPRYTEIAKLNNISSPYVIYPGDVLTLPDSSGSSGSSGSSSGSSGSSSPTSTKKTVNKPKIEFFGLKAGTTRTMFAAWTWTKKNTKEYRVRWSYYTNGYWFTGSDTTIKYEVNENLANERSEYTAPDDATQVRFKVLPKSETHTVNDVETEYWTAGWGVAPDYDFSNNPPTLPSVPEVKIEKYILTAELTNLVASDLNATHVQFQVVKDDTSIFTTSENIPISELNHVTYTCTIAAGAEYKVRCRTYNSKTNKYSDEWTEFSGNSSTIPAAPSGITTIRAESETSIYLKWAEVSSATSYDLEYATKTGYFDGSDQTTEINGIEGTHYLKEGLTSGEEYFFRVRAVNSAGESAWSGIKSVVIGEKPTAPTTWSSTTTALVGEDVTLYWSHNSPDNSTQTYAEVEIDTGSETKTYVIDTAEEEDDEKTMRYTVDTSAYPEGTKLLWRVRTAGITKQTGAWSIQRSIDVYAPPSLELRVTDVDGNSLSTLSSFPLYIEAIAGQSSIQKPIGYHVVVTPKNSYETVDNIGNTQLIKRGAEVYSKHFNTSKKLILALSAGHINLENGISYTVTCTVGMDSGLTAEASITFKVDWVDEEYAPDAEIGINKERCTASIHPYCQDESGDLVKDVLLSVYRREFDGGFTEIATDISNSSNTFVTDPHPALDYARYRIVAITKSTGAVSYYDVPGYPVGQKAIIIQWDDEWTNYNSTVEDPIEQPIWAGSMLKLPYNIDVSESADVDTSLVSYIGRKHPVGYYGTQVGQKATWNTTIPKTDTETLYALRRLSIWTGNVYVREPSGTGYWANISVSFSQKHCDVTIPVTLNVVRVSGGV